LVEKTIKSYKLMEDNIPEENKIQNFCRNLILPNLPKQIILLVCDYLNIEDIFLSFRFLKKQYNN
jgi:hypothetical protein